MSQHTLVETRTFSLRVPQLRVTHLWRLLPISIILWMGFMHPLRKLDFWWHLKVGEWIVTTHQIPQTDMFSYTQAGAPFLHQNWLGEVLYYLVYHAGGPPLMITLHTFLLVLTFLPIYHLCLQEHRHLRLAVLSSLVAAVLLGVYSNVRPQSYSFALFAVFYWVLWQYRERRKDYLWWLPPLMALWVNLHGAFVLGIGLIGLFLGSEIVRRLVHGATPFTLSPQALKKLGIVLFFTLLATLINPQTYRVFAYVRQLQVDPASQTFVQEWQVPDIKNPTELAIFFIPVGLLLVVLLYSRRRPDLTELLLFLGFAAFGLMARRNAIWFALIAAPILARYVVTLDFGEWVWNLRRRLRPPTIHPAAPPHRQGRRRVFDRLNWFILGWLLLFTVLVSPWVRPRIQLGRLHRQLIEETTPIGAAEYIAQNHLMGNIFHTQDYGDYLIWRLWPAQRSFIDGRVHLFKGDFVRDYILTFHDDRWEARIQKYDIKYLLLPKNDERTTTMIADARNSDQWVLLFEDDVSVLFEKVATQATPGEQ